MKTQLAWHNLLHNKARTSLAIAGVVFSIVLMFMQLGFLEAVKVSATLVYDTLDFDVCLRSKDYLHLADARWISRNRVTQATGVSGVQIAVPLTITTNAWSSPQSAQRRSILCLGVVPTATTFRDPEIDQRVRDLLVRPDLVLIDTKTRPEYGPPRDGRHFGPADHGTRVEVGGTTVTIAGDYTCGAGLSSGGALIISDLGLRTIVPGLTPDQVSLGLLKVVPGEDPRQVADRLRERLPDDMDVLTRDEVLRAEVSHWVNETNYGMIFQAGVLVALIVGTVIVYQVLANDVESLLPEYATIKAIGYGNGYLAAVILQQALVLAVLGFLCGVVIAELLYSVTSAGAHIPVRMTAVNLALVLVLAILMCICSGLAALSKAFRADPADLF